MGLKWPSPKRDSGKIRQSDSGSPVSNRTIRQSTLGVKMAKSKNLCCQCVVLAGPCRLSEWISKCAQMCPKFWRGRNWVWCHIWYYLSWCTTCPNDFGFEAKTFAPAAIFTFSVDLRHFGPSVENFSYSLGIQHKHLS